MRIVPEDPATPDIVALLDEHLAHMHATSPAESVHALDVARLKRPGIAFLAARDDDGVLLGVGAIAELDSAHGEIKSMRTAASARGRGVAAEVLTQLLATALERGYDRVSLETGTQEFFAPAHRLYARAGFTPCGPFADYTDDPHSRFFTKSLEPGMRPEPLEG
ncbi:GNAT family N-acetyltransferase [Demequina capsici]|uniref:GNAT family N-acetyltransferase n=1 Tax=Demequina capsici TaxID=3075620 RepID=A0AA96JAL0_9MICO|nr:MULTISPECIES: GNAT family N-acetyltransferase [unclassified Demequina]WNM24826.1 GNAT family N-acetyltransferase [Demequina sp. OYTSA14]WNM27733.1 GNAT family N-acetyltransferase [Demequina sp. PMTSA13]